VSRRPKTEVRLEGTFEEVMKGLLAVDPKDIAVKRPPAKTRKQPAKKPPAKGPKKRLPKADSRIRKKKARTKGPSRNKSTMPGSRSNK
jgi:hypothetical protein